MNWKLYVNEALCHWKNPELDSDVPKVGLYMLNTKLVAISPAYDYMHHNEELINLSLYQWARCYHRIPLPKKNLPINPNEISCLPTTHSKHVIRFTKHHPLYDSHACMQYVNHEQNIVNFIGKVLPRPDHGDRDDYCSTMLVLFKPWRSGKDLKTENQSWEDAFNVHNFTSREKQIISNFNIKYECLDAQDDYNAQLKAGHIQSTFNFWDNNDASLHSTLDDHQNPITNNIELQMDDETNQNFTETNEILNKESSHIRSILHLTGWNNAESSLSKTPHTLLPFTPQTIHTGAEWKANVQNCKAKEIAKRMSCQAPITTDSRSNTSSETPNSVKIIDKCYLQKKFYSKSSLQMTGLITSQFQLNIEQEHAFNIVTQHALLPTSDQLKLYIGGMGGTGKTQVINAISHFFTQTGQAFRLVLMAPTGTAAALLSGSTYHSLLGINDWKKDPSKKKLTETRTRMLRVDYIFLDEVSMLSCRDLYRISAQLARIYNCHDKPFGGANMIFAGDFGQLPPPIGGERVALYSRFVGIHATNLKSQEEAMGHALWHQVTSVVILRQNMRQKFISADDDKLRTALSNMRYKACTKDDIQFLKSKITSSHSSHPSISDPNFTSVSIITARNIDKDEINRLGCIKFAKLTGQNLTHFYSQDRLPPSCKPGIHSTNTPAMQMNSIPYGLQTELWNLPHSAADKHIPGKLSLCIGMPIMIKYNEATELGITNGQDATVVGWQSYPGIWKLPVLDTLFVELTNPPKPIQLDDLPPNIIPLTRSEKTISCKLKNDRVLTINRAQIEILPNFAMTDYASQGKTREYNVVDLSNC